MFLLTGSSAEQPVRSKAVYLVCCLFTIAVSSFVYSASVLPGNARSEHDFYRRLLQTADDLGLQSEYSGNVSGQTEEVASPPCMREGWLPVPFQHWTQHEITAWAARIARSRNPLIKDPLIGWMIKEYKIDMSEALQPSPYQYKTLNDFFVRALKPSVRPVTPEPLALASPVDGVVDELGKINVDVLIQAKGKTYTLQSLLTDATLSKQFRNGSYVTQYLSPAQYHRVHMPFTGRLLKTIYVPGALMSVSPHCVATIDHLYANNERLISVFETEQGPMVVVMVGATVVGGIETVWGGLAGHGAKRVVTDYSRNNPSIELQKGQEMGRFNVGSTVITLFQAEKVSWDVGVGNMSLMGSKLGSLATPPVLM